MAIRYYSSIAQQTTLTASISPSNTSITVAATTGFPGSVPFTLALDYGAANEELVDVTMVAGFNLTIVRSVDGTPASSHNAGAFVRHVSSARDFTEFQAHIAGTTNVHGLAVGSAVVGTTDTQTLTNKTLTKAHGSLENVDLFNTGAGNVTSVIGDSANPTAARMNWLKDEISLTPLITFNSSGGGIFAKSTTDVDGTYKVRVVEDVGGADRAALLAGGTLALTPTTTTTFPSLDVTTPDLSTTKYAIRTHNGSNDGLAVFNDGHSTITSGTAAQIPLVVKGAAAQSVNLFSVANSAGTSQLVVNNTGKTVAGELMDVRNNSQTAAAIPLRVFANTTSQTGNLQQWVSQANAVVASVGNLGAFTSAGDINGVNIVASGDFEAFGNVISFAQNSITYKPAQTGSGTFSVSAATSQTVAVVFPTAFTQAPNVHVNINSTAGATLGWHGQAISITASGFTARFAGASATFSNAIFNWTAISTV